MAALSMSQSSVLAKVNAHGTAWQRRRLCVSHLSLEDHEDKHDKLNTEGTPTRAVQLEAERGSNTEMNLVICM